MDTERTQARLENAQTVEPMLGALRTISLGTWQSATNRLQRLEGITEEFHQMLASLLPVLSKVERGTKMAYSENVRSSRQVIVLAGTERGLCGKLDQDLIDFVKNNLPIAERVENCEVIVFGGRLSKAVDRQLIKPTHTYSASSTALPAFPKVFEVTRDWIRRVANNELFQVQVFYTQFHSAAHREPAVLQLLPYELQLETSRSSGGWPPPIVETDPRQLFMRIYEQLTAIRLYEALLQTKASIHSARFQMMEDSTKNADRLIEDLTIMLQTERRQAITREMQELAIGAGLLQH